MIATQRNYLAAKIISPQKLHSGSDRLVNQLVGRWKRRRSLVSGWHRQAQTIVQQSLNLQPLSDSELGQQLEQMKTQQRRQKDLAPEELNAVLGLLAEVAFRTLGMRPYPVQMVAAIALFHGYLTEMATGEGKTLTVAFAAIMTAWSARPCHVVTANDYLAARDAASLAPFYNYCSVSVGSIAAEMNSNQRRQNYNQDIVYTTGKELLADFLRDQLSAQGQLSSTRRLIQHHLRNGTAPHNIPVMRGIDTAIIDEADAVLIDEAVTPLIIAQPQPNDLLNEACQCAWKIAAEFVAGQDYQIDMIYREITLTTVGAAKVAVRSNHLPALFQASHRADELITTALIAREFYVEGQQYVIKDNKVIIVDEFTGRMMPGRSWRQGLHQAIEVQERLPLTDPSETLNQLSFQNFFRLFRRLSGLTGTARETADEFWDIYRLPVVTIPTNKPCQRKTLPHQLFLDQQSKWQAICTEIAECFNHGQPVLVGTRSVSASETLATLLDQQNIPYQLLNAVKHQEEAQIITAAGQYAQVTIATNMAGRGADIRLGEGVAELGGLLVILSEPHEAKRIDRQLEGRCARQGDPGMFRKYVCLEDRLLAENLPKPLLKACSRIFARHTRTQYLAAKLVAYTQRRTQNKAVHQRKAVLNNDKWLSDALSFSPSGAPY